MPSQMAAFRSDVKPSHSPQTLDVPLAVRRRLELRCHRFIASYFGSFSSAPRSPDSRSLLPVSADDDGSSVHRLRAVDGRGIAELLRSVAVGNLRTTPFH
ncbi:hypothetical protein VZT92_007529 [Zoarces viviparus]|uniref:Uncharacterized protein n=1 Tax=Zoarces viviparus TaxID=48416 RepID=A0AAW1FLR3_ZOAVI